MSHCWRLVTLACVLITHIGLSASAQNVPRNLPGEYYIYTGIYIYIYIYLYVHIYICTVGALYTTTSAFEYSCDYGILYCSQQVVAHS